MNDGCDGEPGDAFVSTGLREPLDERHGLSAVLVTVPIAALRRCHSPRQGAERADHVRIPAQTVPILPPIVVHRPTIIDGLYRLRACVLRGDTDVDVRFFDGDEGDAFVPAVRTNVARGRTSPIADRKAAAARIICFSSSLADRKTASATGLAPPTGGITRKRSTAGISPSTAQGSGTTVELLRSDSSLRLNQDGRALLRVHDVQLMLARDLVRLVTAVPDNVAVTVPALAKDVCDSWRTFAEKPRERAGELP